MTSPTPPPDSPDRLFPPQGGELASLLRAFDWSRHPLGSPERWPPTLKTAVRVLLMTPLPMVLLWGPEGFLLYNDGYAVFSGARHPGLLGMPAREAWPEVSDFNDHVIKTLLRGETLSYKEQPLVLHRPGLPEQTWLDLTYSPLLDEEGVPVGGLAIVVESTARVLEEQRRQAAERSLSLANERIQLALDAGAVVGTWAWDIPTDHFTADARFARSLSLDADQLARGVSVGHVVESIHPEDRERVGVLRQASLRQGGPYRAEYRTRQRDGSWRWFESNGHCELDARGHALRMLGVLLDIDARKQAELRQAFVLSLTDRLRSLSEPLDIMATACEQLGRQLGVNRVGYAEFDLGARTMRFLSSWTDGQVDPLQGTVSMDSYHPEYIAPLLRGQTVVVSDIVLGGTGSVVDVTARGSRSAVVVPLVREQMLGGQFYISCREVRAWLPQEIALAEEVAMRTWEAVARARAEAELRELNATLERQVEERTRERNRLWELSQAPFLIADAQGRWLRVSPAWTQLLGWSEKELLGHTSEWMEHPDDRLKTREEVVHLGAGQRTLQFENRFRHKDGSYRWFSWLTSPADGLLYCVARDVTQEKERQAELEKTQEQLRQSQKMEAVGQLTGGIAHDFNNLLAGIMGSLDLLGRRIQSGKLDNVRRYIDAATTSASRAATLTHRLLAFARRQSLDVKPTDVNALVHSLEELLRRTLGENISFQAVLKADLWLARTDANQFENALLNLVINARDAMPEGGKLTVETSNIHLDETYTQKLDGGLPSGDYVLLSVSDTGTGMPPEVVARAFEPFFTTKPIGQGTGLGLSMIYGFVRQSGGHVRIHSQVGRGTTVKLFLPRQQTEASASEAQAPVELQRARAGETVLVVEDEPAVRMVVLDVLEDLGYQTLEAADSRQALPHLEGKGRIDLLVTDVGLPGMNGRQLAEIARQRRPGLKVLFVTGYAENAAVRGGFLEPGMEMITKPFAVEVLAARLRDMLSKN